MKSQKLLANIYYTCVILSVFLFICMFSAVDVEEDGWRTVWIVGSIATSLALLAVTIKAPQWLDSHLFAMIAVTLAAYGQIFGTRNKTIRQLYLYRLAEEQSWPQFYNYARMRHIRHLSKKDGVEYSMQLSQYSIHDR